MGLDAVELLMAFEEDFELAIPDADAAQLTTPNDVTDYLMMRLGSPTDTKPHPCLSQRQFYHLRRILIEEFGITRQQIRRQTPIRQLIQKPHTQWQQFAQVTGYAPIWQFTSGAFLPHAIPLMLAVILLGMGTSPWLAAALPLAGWIAAWKFIGSPKDERIPTTTATVGDIVPYIALPDRKNWSRQQILQRVITITAEQLAIPRAQIRPEHRFIDDLGMD